MKNKNISFLKIFFLLLAFILNTGLALSQQLKRPVISEYSNFFELQTDMNAFYEVNFKGKASGYNQWKRAERFYTNRVKPNGDFINLGVKYFRENDKIAPAESASRSRHGDWNFIGPTSYAPEGSINAGGLGRVNCVAIHPTNENILWVGTPGGGLWKSTSGGNAWTCLTDGLPNMGVSSIAVNPSNPNIIYMLTGDGDGLINPSIGVLKTTNGGVTWKRTGLTFSTTQFIFGYDLKIHPSNSNLLFVATTDGLYRSVDAGNNWTQQDPFSYRDIEFHPTNNNIIYIAGTQLLKSTFNGGNSWVTITNNVLPLGANADPARPIDRIELAVSPSEPNSVFAIFGFPTTGPIGGLEGIYKSTNQGNTWSLLVNSPNMLDFTIDGSGSGSQSFYDLALAVNPTNPNFILMGGINNWRSTNAGVTWAINTYWNNTTSTQYVHADIHELVYSTNNNLYACTDGGIYKSTNNGNSWSDISEGLGISQSYDVTGTPQETELFMSGTQDNGVNTIENGNYLHNFSGDGICVMINYNDSDERWGSTQFGNLRRRDGSSWVQDSPVGATAPFLTKYIMDHADPDIIFGGLVNIWRRNKNFFGTITWNDLGASVSRGYVDLAQAKSNRNFLYAASADTLYRSENILAANPSYTLITSGLPVNSENITGVTVDATNENHVYVTFGGFTSGTKVYRSTNKGASWTNISTNLPNVPVNCIVFGETGTSNNPIYVGTDIGIFYLDNNNTNWIPFRNGMPTIIIKDLYINPTDNKITAGTFGRGIWRSSTRTPCVSNITLTNNNGTNLGFTRHNALNLITSSKMYNNQFGVEVEYIAGDCIELGVGFELSSNAVFEAYIDGCDN